MKLLLCVAIMLSTAGLKAQNPFGPSKSSGDDHLFYIELLGGAIWPNMVFTDTPYDKELKGKLIRQNSGIALRYEKIGRFSVGALFTYREQGVYFPKKNEKILKTNYVNLFVPVEKDFHLSRLDKKVGPSIVFFAGPYVAYFLGGSSEDMQHDFKLSTTEINQLDAGAEAGLGFRLPTFSIENRSNLNLKFSYYYGMVNAFPSVIPDVPDDRLNSLLLSKTGTRINRGFRLTLSYEIALKRHKIETFTAGGDGKKTYKRFVLF